MRKFDIGYYPEFKLSENLPIPKELEEVLKLAWDTHYSDFNEGLADVMGMCTEVLYYFGSASKWYSVEHIRNVYMALAFVHASNPTIEKLRPEDDRPKKVLEIVNRWFKASVPDKEEVADILFPDTLPRVAGSFLDECYDNLYNLLKTLNNPTLNYHFLKDILYDAFTGEWCGGSLAGSGSRDMFNWWLIEVIPAAYNLQLPPSIRPVVWKFPFRCETPEMFFERMKGLENEKHP